MPPQYMPLPPYEGQIFSYLNREKILTYESPLQKTGGGGGQCARDINSLH